MTSPSDLKKAVPETFKNLLASRGMSQASVASAADTSQTYVSLVVSGSKTPSARWLETISLAMNLSAEEEVALNRAAALDNGFKIDLTKK